MYGTYQEVINDYAMKACNAKKAIIKKWLEGTPEEERLIAFATHEKYMKNGEIWSETWTIIIMNELARETRIKSYHGDGKTKKPKGYIKQELAKEIKRWNYMTIGQEGQYKVSEKTLDDITSEMEVNENGEKTEITENGIRRK